MTSTVATEIPQTPASAKPFLETWGKNERMRHIPPAQWITRKVDEDLRRRIEIVCSSFERLSASDERRPAAEQALSAISRSMERIADLAKQGRAANQHGGGDLVMRVRESVQHAVANLNTVDENLFGRRYPSQTFERSKAEPLVGALLAAIDALHRVCDILRNADPSLDERLLEGLVTLEQPLRAEPIVEDRL